MNKYRETAIEAIDSAARTEMTVQLAYHFEIECALMARCDAAGVHDGIDGREYRTFEGDGWRVVLVGSAPSARVA